MEVIGNDHDIGLLRVHRNEHITRNTRMDQYTFEKEGMIKPHSFFLSSLLSMTKNLYHVRTYL